MNPNLAREFARPTCAAAMRAVLASLAWLASGRPVSNLGKMWRSMQMGGRRANGPAPAQEG